MSRGEKRSGGTRGSGTRCLTVRVRSARGRKTSSTRWLQRQLNDPYVQEAQRLGYRSRAAFKIIDLDDRLKFLKKGARVVDLGAAPGGWTQIAVERVGAGRPGGGLVVALDILEFEPVPGAACITQDFMKDDAPEILRDALDGRADVVLSDMAANTTGHPQTDHLRVMALVEAAYLFATEVLSPGGTFIAKVFQGGTEAALLADIKTRFRTVRHIKPPSSRKESAEVYLVATGFKG